MTGDPSRPARPRRILHPSFAARLASQSSWLFAALTSLICAIAAQAPRLELLDVELAGTVRFRLHGETNADYAIELSTNFTTWQDFATARTTNGIVDFSYSTTTARHTFLRARSEQTVTSPSVTPQADPTLSVTSMIHPDGGKMTLFTRDLRMITITFPPGSFLEPTEVRASSVTNLVGLPFTRALGAVQLEPEGLSLLGAATISIEYPPDINRLSVISFNANNDGTGLGLAIDRVFTNHVLIPFTDLGLYGSSTGTLAQLELFVPSVPPPPPLSGLGVRTPPLGDPALNKGCRLKYPNEFRPDYKQFPETILQCFKESADRAIVIQFAIRAHLTCWFRENIAVAIGQARQDQQLGRMTDEEAGAILEDAVRQICPFYDEALAPLWQEARGNCALGIVLMQAMLTFEQQVQFAGMTNLATCNYSLARNIDNVCKVAETCLTEIRACCALGHKGQEKYSEITQLVNKFELLSGNTCLPGGMDNPTVDGTVTECLSNAWYGTFKMRHFGTYAETETLAGGSSSITQLEDIDVKFDGEVFETQTSTLPGFGSSASLTIRGHGIIDLDSVNIAVENFQCGAARRTVLHTRTDGTTNGATSPFGQYTVGIFVAAQQPGQYQLTAGGNGLISSTEVNGGHRWHRDCDGVESSEAEEESESEKFSTFPILPPTFFRFGDDTNKISGVHRVIDNSGKFPITTEFTWNLTRHREGAPR